MCLLLLCVDGRYSKIQSQLLLIDNIGLNLSNTKVLLILINQFPTIMMRRAHYDQVTLVKQCDISVRDTLNYQNNCRNTFGWLVDLSYKVTKLEILIISHVCRWVFQNPVTIIITL